jgi:crotonobetainyl-CoA:carnitine CoA-transferase CaiB-like acyl-CoA transferase
MVLADLGADVLRIDRPIARAAQLPPVDPLSCSRRSIRLT